ncbi:hypothetical protein PRIPAC_83648 [Pristionchus pacificus]|uniref:Ribosome production factor 2 homolog n=1 Tax=Pristionchus pacificus TaxID=54126 RepID=A0A2A6BMN3_PRIPA|nr:hypothetical protein PRIPAC_83648 [Pristionchus pacificus]|eukprot:PDM67108.1 hypothetical protein PRIPAC_48525 [Pristionchus pacificus]
MKVFKNKTRKGKRVLEDRAPKVNENDKTAIIVKGGHTSDIVTKALTDLYLLRKPLATHMKKKNPIHPFEDETPLTKFAAKFDTSLFLFGSNSKKRPNALIFGRLFDGQLLDMVELKITSFTPSSEFNVPKPVLGSKPCIVLEGTAFETDPTMKRVGSMFVDWFQGPKLDQVRLQGLESVAYLSTDGETISLRVYRTVLLKSNTTTPRVELRLMGPAIDFKLDRKKLADDALFKTACKQPKELNPKRRKNTSEDVMGNQLARIHIGKQRTDEIQTRKVKALRKPKPAKEAAAAPPAAAAEAMEE